MRWFGIEIGADDIGLDLIAVDGGWAVGMVDRVEHRQQLSRSVAVALHDEGQRGPDRTMGVLSAILPNARRVAPDITGIARRMIEGRGE